MRHDDDDCLVTLPIVVTCSRHERPSGLLMVMEIGAVATEFPKELKIMRGNVVLVASMGWLTVTPR